MTIEVGEDSMMIQVEHPEPYQASSRDPWPAKVVEIKLIIRMAGLSGASTKTAATMQRAVPMYGLCLNNTDVFRINRGVMPCIRASIIPSHFADGPSTTKQCPMKFMGVLNVATTR